MAQPFDPVHHWGDVLNGKITVVQDDKTPKDTANHDGDKVYVHPDTYRDFIGRAGHLQAPPGPIPPEHQSPIQPRRPITE